MTIKRLFPEMYRVARITWSKPIKYEKLLENGSPYDDTAYFYIIIGRCGNRKPRLFYIGKTYQQVVSFRLSQKDHQRRYTKLKAEYPDCKLFVSLGQLKIDGGYVTDKRVDEIERILIYTHDSDYLINVKGLYEHKVTEQYKIINRGADVPLWRKVYLGMMYEA